MYRQGDVLITPVPAIPKGLKCVAHERCVLAEGEATGHAHVAIGPDVEMYEDDNGVLWLSAPSGCVVNHEEHGTITLPPGSHRVTRQREWTDADEPRQVAD